MSTAELLTRDDLTKHLKSCSLAQLTELAEERALVVGGSGKSGKPTPTDFVKVLAAYFALNPTHAHVRSNVLYHNGAVVGGYGLNWNVDEERIIPLPAFRQITSDISGDHFTLVNTLTLLPTGEKDANKS